MQHASEQASQTPKGPRLDEDGVGGGGGVAAALAQLGERGHVVQLGVAEDQDGGGRDRQARQHGGAGPGGTLHTARPEQDSAACRPYVCCEPAATVRKHAAARLLAPCKLRLGKSYGPYMQAHWHDAHDRPAHKSTLGFRYSTHVLPCSDPAHMLPWRLLNTKSAAIKAQ